MKQFFFCSILLIILAGCGNSAKDKSVANEKAIKVNVTINQVVGIGKIVPESNILQLSSAVSGIVGHIYKKENDSVNVGEVILELKHEVEDAKVNELSQEMNIQAAQIKADESAIEEFQAKYENANAELQRLQTLLSKGAETQQTVDNASTNLKGFKSNLDRLHNNVLVSKSKLTAASASLEVAKQQRAQTIIKSPAKGKILEISTLVGSAIDNKTSFVQISPKGNTIADCEIDELFADKIADGQKAWVRHTGMLDTLSTGTVYFTSGFLKKKSLFTDQAGEKEDRRVREIKIVLDNPEHLLLNERVECVINISAAKKNQ